MPTVYFTQSARTDLLDAWLYIAEENPSAADRVLDAIEQDAHKLAQQPRMGRNRPDLAPQLRSWPTRTPYLLFYLLSDDGITIVRVLHHARDVLQLDFN